MYFFDIQGRTKIEAEHFVTQRYGNSDYRGARWWMVETADQNVKDIPEFADRCALARQEMVEMNEGKMYGGLTVAQIIAPDWPARQHNTFFEPVVNTGRERGKNVGVDGMIERWGCDPIQNRANGASGNAVIKLLPDMLYNNHNEAPHGGSNWGRPTGQNSDISPRAYYRLNLPKGGQYSVSIQGYRTGADSGSVHFGHAPSPEVNETITKDRGISWGGTGWASRNTSFRAPSAGEYYIIIAGREDGFIVDYLTVTPN